MEHTFPCPLLPVGTFLTLNLAHARQWPGLGGAWTTLDETLPKEGLEKKLIKARLSHQGVEALGLHSCNITSKVQAESL